MQNPDSEHRAKVPEDLREILQREQVDDNFRYARAASIAGVFNAVVAVAALWSSAYAVSLLAWLVLVLSGGLLRAAAMQIDNSKLWEQRRAVEGIAFFNGAAWAIGVAAMAAVATPTQYVIIIILCSGMMGASVTTYTSMSRAAMLFIIPLGLGGLAALWINPVAPSIAGTLLLGSYMMLLSSGSRRREKRFVERVIAREELNRSSETVQLLLNDFESQSADWLWQVDQDGIIAEPSERFAEASGRGQQLLEDLPFTDLFDEGHERAIMVDHLASRYSFRNLTVRLTIAGEPHWWTVSAQPTGTGGMRGVASDVTAQKRAEERVSYMAHYDGLTDLANRFLFNETLQRNLGQSRGGKREDELAVLCLDLDSFKSVNDTLGHPTGDRLLAEVARRIEGAVRGDDLVARLGGDEFAVLIKGSRTAERAQQVGDRILEAVEKPFEIDGSQVITSASIGIALSNVHGETAGNTDLTGAAALMKRADLALYAAKEAGRNRTTFFEAGMDQVARERRELEMDLRSALIHGELELHYQPLVNIKSGKTVAFEALVRWNHPTRGVVMPDDFIGLAEETGLIVQLGEWVIRQACSEVSNWPSDLRVSVNLSPVQMRSSSLISTVFGAVAHAGIKPSQLELEITESVLLHDSEINMATLHKLHDFGIRIALDDFGTGYSSLNYLRSFPFDKIKIDRCFVTDLASNPDCQAIVRAVTGLASSLGMETTAEGVELACQLDQLREEGCTEAQGYLFSRPEKAEQFSDLRLPKKSLPNAEITKLALGLAASGAADGIAGPAQDETPASTESGSVSKTA